MKKLTDIFADKKRTFSFELFPAKTEKGYQNLLATIAELATLNPDYISCTYGAGGGSRERTFDIVQHIQDTYHLPGVAHLTCVCHTRDEIKAILHNMQERGICNVLALRGDPPRDNPVWQPGPANFQYSCELCAFIRPHYGDFFAIGVAGFPEGHILCPDREQDARYLKIKIDSGADFVTSQLFFNNQDYFNYVERLRKLGVNARVIPGIFPITNYDNLIRFCQNCGTTVPQEIHDIFRPVKDDPERSLEEGIGFAVRQCRDLLDHGAPGLHFYALNKLHPVDAILTAVRG
jgi:methylenetetrahydrofolate reductase (NADPH)